MNDDNASVLLSERKQRRRATRTWNEMASGKFIAFLDSDDEWMKDKLLIQTAEAKLIQATCGVAKVFFTLWRRCTQNRA